jgi:hypothetical protein
MLNVTSHREMQIKTRYLYLFILTMDGYDNNFVKMENNKCWQGSKEIGILVLSYWEYELVEMLWKIVRQLLKILKCN